MFEKSSGIVLHNVKYSDNSSIVTLYTQKFGRLAVLIRHPKSKKSLSRRSILQPLFLLNLNIQYRKNRDIQQCKEIINTPVFSDIPFNILKGSIAMFLSDFLHKVLKEEEPNELLYEFLFNSIQVLDQTNRSSSNFHLVFLYQLSRFLGFQPEENYSNNHLYFHLVKGRFSSQFESTETSLDERISLLFRKLSKLKFSNMEEVELSKNERKVLLKGLIKYYNFHLPEIGKIKSLEVLEKIFE